MPSSPDLRPPPFQAFLEETRDEVMGLLVNLVGRSAAEDCFQETYLAALRAYPELRHAEALRGWVMRIARNKAADHGRRAGRTVPVAEPGVEPDADGDPSAAIGDPAVWRRVASLPPKQRAAVTLRFTGDLPYSEVGRMIGCSEEAARRSVHEGLKTLRRAYL